MKKALIILVAGLMAAPVSAKVDFYAFDGPEHLQVGDGGFKQVKDGIEFWNEGYPSRQYIIVGLVRDQEACAPGVDRVIRYGQVAKVARKAHAGAVILLPSTARSVNLSPSITDKASPEELLARHGIRAMGNNVSLAPEALSYHAPELSIGDEACGESRFVAVRYVADVTKDADQ